MALVDSWYLIPEGGGEGWNWFQRESTEHVAWIRYERKEGLPFTYSGAPRSPWARWSMGFRPKFASDADRDIYDELAAGWRFRWMILRTRIPGTVTQPSMRWDPGAGVPTIAPPAWMAVFWIGSSEHPKPVPNIIHWPGLLGNVAFYAAVIALPLFTLATIRILALELHRARHNRCPSCGYDRAGLTPGAACPECGTTLAQPA